MRLSKLCPLLLCLPLLAGCGRGMPAGESCLPPDALPDPAEAVEAVTIPPDWDIPKEAVYCQIEDYEISRSYRFYDAHDNMILERDDDEDDALRIHYTYHDDGTYAYRSTQDIFGVEKERYVYDDDKNVAQCFPYEGGKETGYIAYEYDERGQVTREYYMRLDDHVCMYDLHYKNDYDDAGRLTAHRQTGGAYAVDTYYDHDAQGNVIHETLWSPLLREIVGEERYAYGDDGRLLTHASYGSTVIVQSRYTYIDLTEDTQKTNENGGI
ncbi:MAG: hypothetical protein IKI21_07040 [Oscillospiraceae bacterium]|nr:hypothetical protein [Oscillospiraceae bacterium]